MRKGQLSCILGLAAVPAAYGVAFPGPRPTQSSEPDYLGISPRPTVAPYNLMADLRKRDEAKTNVCGFVDGSEGWSIFSCLEGRTCALATASGGSDVGMLGCCTDTSEPGQCGFIRNCYDDEAASSSCTDSACRNNPFNLLCTDATARYCASWTFTTDNVQYYGCTFDSVSTWYTVSSVAAESSLTLTVSNAYITADSVTEETSFPTGSIFSFSLPSLPPMPSYTLFSGGDDTDTSYSGGGYSSKPKVKIGPIIGGVVAGVAAIAAGIIALIARKKRAKKAAEVSAAQSGPPHNPPQMIQGGPGGPPPMYPNAGPRDGGAYMPYNPNLNTPQSPPMQTQQPYFPPPGAPNTISMYSQHPDDPNKLGPHASVISTQPSPISQPGSPPPQFPPGQNQGYYSPQQSQSVSPPVGVSEMGAAAPLQSPHPQPVQPVQPAQPAQQPPQQKPVYEMG